MHIPVTGTRTNNEMMIYVLMYICAATVMTYNICCTIIIIIYLQKSEKTDPTRIIAI